MIRRSGKHSWEIALELTRDPLTGKRRRRWFTINGTKKAAEKALREAWLFLRDFMQFRVFDELSYDLLRHLESGAELANPPKEVLVDEYQDLTPCELALLRALAERFGTAVLACGDDRCRRADRRRGSSSRRRRRIDRTACRHGKRHRQY